MDFVPANFILRGGIADIDETTCDQPHHPSTLVLIERANDIARVIVPLPVLADMLPLLCPGRPLEVGGKIEKYEGREHYVATRLRLLAGGN